MALATGTSAQTEPVGIAEDGNTSLRPTHIIHIVPHTLFIKNIKISDFTSELIGRYDGLTKDFEKEVERHAKTSPAVPIFTITRCNWIGSRFLVKDASGDQVAEWKAPLFSTGSTRLTFPTDSEHSSHPLEMKPTKFARRSERFVKDSVLYTWECPRLLTSDDFSLYKTEGSKKVEVAKYSQGFGLTTGGTLVLDAREVDELVAVVTCVVMLKKKNQRRAEWWGAGGAGGS